MILTGMMIQRPLMGNLLRCDNYITFITSSIIVVIPHPVNLP